MEPNEQEKESKLVLTLLWYVLTVIGETDSLLGFHVKREKDEQYGSPMTIHRDTAALCNYCRKFTAKQAKTILWDGKNPDARKLADWWQKHQKADAKREAKEKADKKRTEGLKKLMAKLSPAERALLKGTKYE